MIGPDPNLRPIGQIKVQIGIGSSSSHTVGPMGIARRFVSTLDRQNKLSSVSQINVKLQGSLALTGVGHGSPIASVLGLLGTEPEFEGLSRHQNLRC